MSMSIAGMCVDHLQRRIIEHIKYELSTPIGPSSVVQNRTSSEHALFCTTEEGPIGVESSC